MGLGAVAAWVLFLDHLDREPSPPLETLPYVADTAAPRAEPVAVPVAKPRPERLPEHRPGSVPPNR